MNGEMTLAALVAFVEYSRNWYLADGDAGLTERCVVRGGIL